MTSGDSLPSPESTVTSLLASSGRLRSSLHPEPVRTIRYKNRHYDSATEALEAYIADFQRSQPESAASVGQLELPAESGAPAGLHAGFRNTDVLKESLSERELLLLHLPPGPPHRASDRHSVTTDDLLLLPCDGSLPITCTSAALSRSGGRPLGCGVNSSSWSRFRPGGGVKKALRGCQGAVRTPGRVATSGRERSLRVGDLLAGSLTSQRGAPLPASPLASRASHHLPRWITSHSSEMDFSGVTSIPDLRYPAWLRECHDPTGVLAGAPCVPSWVRELERDSVDGQQEPKGHWKGKGQRVSEQAPLREPRLQFTETLAAAEDEDDVWDEDGVWDEARGPFRGDRIGFLIQRAERVLTSPSLGLHGPTKAQGASPGDTEFVDAERLWDNPPVTFKSPVPVGGAETTEDSQEDTMEKATGSCSSGYSSRKHPGPVEALKQMLFSLQAVEQRVTRQEYTGANSRPSETVPTPRTRAGRRETEETAPTPPTQAGRRETEEVPQAESDYETQPGGQSLHRALLHLGRLKSLVDEMKERKAGDLREGELSLPAHPVRTEGLMRDRDRVGL